MALLTVTQSKRQATPVALVTPDLNGDSFPNTGREALLVQPFPAGVYSNPQGQVTVNYSLITDLKVAAVRIS